MQEWHKRVKLLEGDLHKQIQAYTEAVTTVDPQQAVGKPHSLWCAFAHFYERHGDIINARAVFDKATQVCATHYNNQNNTDNTGGELPRESVRMHVFFGL
jgi:pre-mRNA-splicing factor SYF1